MKRITSKIFLIVLLMNMNSISAQSLQEFIDRALEYNYQIRLLRNEERIAANNNTAGNAGQLPVIGVNGTYTSSWNNTRQQFSDGTIRAGDNAYNENINAAALLNWTIFQGFGIRARRDQLGILQEIGEVNTRFYVEQTVADIANAYFQLIYEQEVLENYRQSLEVSEFRMELAQKRMEVGAGSGMEYRQALGDLNTDSIRVLAQQNRLRNLVIELNRIMGTDLQQEIAPVFEEKPVSILPDRQQLMNEAEMNNHLLEQERLNELLAESRLRIARSGHYPQLDLFAGYEFNESRAEVGFIESNRSYGPVVGLSVSFNLYNAGNTRREVRNAEIMQESAGIGREEVSREINAEVLQSYNSYESLLLRISLAEDNVEAMERVYQIAAEQLKLGAINGFDFRTTQLSLLSANLSLSQLKYELRIQEVNIRRLSGNILESYVVD